MIKAGLWQAEAGPRLLIELGWSDTLDPAPFREMARRLRREFGIWRLVLRWFMRDAVNLAVFHLDAREIERDPAGVLLKVASSMVRSAAKRDIVGQLPQQFFTRDGSPTLLGPDGQPISMSSLDKQALHADDYVAPKGEA